MYVIAAATSPPYERVCTEIGLSKKMKGFGRAIIGSIGRYGTSPPETYLGDSTKPLVIG